MGPATLSADRGAAAALDAVGRCKRATSHADADADLRELLEKSLDEPIE
jgi:hypothetical protein